MARWTTSTPCDLALDGEDHPPHDYTHADQMFWCDGEGIESTPIEQAAISWLDEVDWSKVDWDQVVAAEDRRRMAEALAPEEELSLYEQMTSWCDEAPAVVFYSVMAIGLAFGFFLLGITYLLYRNFG